MLVVAVAPHAEVRLAAVVAVLFAAAKSVAAAVAVHFVVVSVFLAVPQLGVVQFVDKTGFVVYLMESVVALTDVKVLVEVVVVAQVLAVAPGAV